MNSKSSPSLSFPCSCLRGPCWHSTPVKARLTQNSECFSILNYVLSSAVGWRRPISRLGGAPERHPDVMAPYHRQALPHTAVWVLQPRHPGGSSWGPAEPSCWQLEGKHWAYITVILKDICRSVLKIPVGAKVFWELEFWKTRNKCALLKSTLAVQSSPHSVLWPIPGLEPATLQFPTQLPTD